MVFKRGVLEPDSTIRYFREYRGASPLNGFHGRLQAGIGTPVEKQRIAAVGFRFQNFPNDDGVVSVRMRSDFPALDKTQTTGE